MTWHTSQLQLSSMFRRVLLIFLLFPLVDLCRLDPDLDGISGRVLYVFFVDTDLSTFPLRTYWHVNHAYSVRVACTVHTKVWRSMYHLVERLRVLKSEWYSRLLLLYNVNFYFRFWRSGSCFFPDLTFSFLSSPDTVDSRFLWSST